MHSIQDVLPQVLLGLQTPEKIGRQKLVQSWTELVGSKIAAHTRPSLSREGHLFVWVDQSTLAFELSQRYSQTLLKRVQNLLGEEQVKSIRFLVGQLR